MGASDLECLSRFLTSAGIKMTGMAATASYGCTLAITPSTLERARTRTGRPIAAAGAALEVGPDYGKRRMHPHSHQQQLWDRKTDAHGI